MERGKKITIKDIAIRAGVSIGTVDRVLHNRGEVSDDTRQRVLDVVNLSGYQPNILARALTRKRLFHVAVLIPNAEESNDYWHAPRQGICKAFDKIKEYGLTSSILGFNMFSLDSFLIQAEKVLKSPPDAVLMSPVFQEATLNFCRNLDQAGIPYVFIDSHLAGTNPLAFFGQNDEQSGRLAARLMTYMTRGNGTVAIVKISRQQANSRHYTSRQSGFMQYISQNPEAQGISVTIVETGDSTPTAVAAGLNPLFESADNVSGIFVINSRSHLVAGYLIDNKHIQLPIIGYDLVADNRRFLEQGVIDFLIGQQPEMQGYNAIMALFDFFMREKRPPLFNYSPIDLITKENIDFLTQGI